MDLQVPSAQQLDALREVANIGGGHAATAFSKLVGGRTVKIEVPRVSFEVSELAELVDGDSQLVAISFQILEELSGRMLLLLTEPDAHALCQLLLNDAHSGELNEAERSALCEAGNIVASACLAAVGTLTGLKILPSAPSLCYGHETEVLHGAAPELADSSSPMVVMQIHFFTAKSPYVRGQLILMPERRSLATLLSKLGL